MVPLKSGVGVIAYDKQEFGCLIFPKGAAIPLVKRKVVRSMEINFAERFCFESDESFSFAGKDFT